MIKSKLIQLIISLAILGAMTYHLGGKENFSALKLVHFTPFVLVFGVGGLFLLVQLWRIKNDPNDHPKSLGVRVMEALNELVGNPVAGEGPVPTFLEVREHRGVMLLTALLGLMPAAFVLVIITFVQLPQPVILMMMLFAAINILGSVLTLLTAIIADQLLVIDQTGITFPAAYKETIPWSNVLSAELRKVRKKQTHYLRVRFQYPNGPSSWKGILGKLNGYFYAKAGEAGVVAKLGNTNVNLVTLQKSIDQYLEKYEKSVSSY